MPWTASITVQGNYQRERTMNWIVTKYLITAAVVVLVSEFAKRSDKLGGFIAALPMVTLLTLIWLHIEQQPESKVANHAWYTFWYVVPTLPMFLAFPFLLPRLGFWPTLAACVVLTVVCFGLFAILVKRFGISLL
jgi:F0F1-type ATP synthase assembly protein I